MIGHDLTSFTINENGMTREPYSPEHCTTLASIRDCIDVGCYVASKLALPRLS
jgi:hypothetical protein